MWPFRKKVEVRSQEVTTLESLILELALNEDKVTREMALNIPTLAGAVELIGNTIAMLPIKLYKIENGKVQKVQNDNRLNLLNNDTKDTLDAFQFKKALIDDYLLDGNGYAYINKTKNNFVSLHYVGCNKVSIMSNHDPIFKDFSILVNGETYKPYQFLKILKNSKNGADGTGIVESNPIVLAVAYNSLKYENILAKTGGNKKGFILAESKLDEDSKKSLKEQWKKMYSNNSENCVVLNKGLDFKESASTSTEMQLNENKQSNGIEICKIINVPPSILAGDGKADESDYEKYVKMAILPLIQAIISALNRDLLLEKQKGSYFFAFDIKELLKGDIEKRFRAYEIAIKNKILGINEVRREENREPILAFEDTVVLGLNDVLYNVQTGTVYTPNTNKTTNMNSAANDLKGCEENENRNTE